MPMQRRTKAVRCGVPADVDGAVPFKRFDEILERVIKTPKVEIDRRMKARRKKQARPS